METRMVAREIECGVLERSDGSVFVAEPGEIIPTNRHTFYDYDAKYLDENGALLGVPADLAPALAAQVKEQARRVYDLVGCRGMARVDFFLTEENEFVVNEVNTIPGFTHASMFPRVMDASGMMLPSVVEHLIGSAQRGFEDDAELN